MEEKTQQIHKQKLNEEELEIVTGGTIGQTRNLYQQLVDGGYMEAVPGGQSNRMLNFDVAACLKKYGITMYANIGDNQYFTDGGKTSLTQEQVLQIVAKAQKK